MMGSFRLRGVHCGSAAVLCVLLLLATADRSALAGQTAHVAESTAPEISAYTENTTRRRKRTRYRSLLAPHERPERPRLA